MGKRIFGVVDGCPETHAAEPAGTLYQALLGTAYADLPAEVQKLHGETGTRVWQGEAEVTGGATILHRLIARILGFPTRSGTTPLAVHFNAKGPRETWTRDFDGEVMVTHQSRGTGRDAHLLVERFGKLTVSLALVVEGDRLRLAPRHWRLMGLPMPRFLLPGGESYETGHDGRFRFHVDVRLPLLGRLVRYRGWLTRAAGDTLGP
ncbi:putative transmembrane protein [Candidatus Rhodobacter oscarellae]|uniref:Putative transmembrane protein n=1 Tax=Candidatus Rhodobacter oscarellae TaxID=1675527 RepID=A0A0J9GZT1_9RHOB|nr:DUF4166 domain-containing protein [Candidatus Rhodobacter lobularis]KMW59003.1 putative transmembrane protein [Candidatus Rhodobacter lobularis]